MKNITKKARNVLGNLYGSIISGGIALLIVWLLNGLWHGAGYTYICYGLLEFTLILSGNLIEPLIKKLCLKLHINRENIIYRILQSIKMTLFVFIGELIFRAPSMSVAISMFKRIINNFKINSELLKIGLDITDYIIVIIFLIVVFIISLLKESGINIREEISKKNTFIRWSIIIY